MNERKRQSQTTLKKKKKREKGYDTTDSRVVSHPSTNLAWRSLTSLFGWEAVLSTQYGRIHQAIEPTWDNKRGC